MVEVVTSIGIERPRSEVAAYAADPDHAPDWYVNIKAVEWKTPKPLAVGTRVAFKARFLGRELSYTYAIMVWTPGERLVMRTTDGPFPMETTYTWEGAGARSTRMTLRNFGKPAGFSALAAPIVGLAMRQANRNDLVRLKSLLER